MIIKDKLYEIEYEVRHLELTLRGLELKLDKSKKALSKARNEYYALHTTSDLCTAPKGQCK